MVKCDRKGNTFQVLSERTYEHEKHTGTQKIHILCMVFNDVKPILAPLLLIGLWVLCKYH